MKGYVEMSSLNAPDNSIPFDCPDWRAMPDTDRIELCRAVVFVLAPSYFSIPDGVELHRPEFVPFITSAALLLANGVSFVVEEDVSPRYLPLAQDLVDLFVDSWTPPTVH